MVLKAISSFCLPSCVSSVSPSLVIVCFCRIVSTDLYARVFRLPWALGLGKSAIASQIAKIECEIRKSSSAQEHEDDSIFLSFSMNFFFVERQILHVSQDLSTEVSTIPKACFANKGALKAML